MVKPALMSMNVQKVGLAPKKARASILKAVINVSAMKDSKEIPAPISTNVIRIQPLAMKMLYFRILLAVMSVAVNQVTSVMVNSVYRANVTIDSARRIRPVSRRQKLRASAK